MPHLFQPLPKGEVVIEKGDFAFGDEKIGDIQSAYLFPSMGWDEEHAPLLIVYRKEQGNV